MLQSMTGFGKATGNFKGKKVTIEVRALNSKTLDLNVRFPSDYRPFEADMRKVMQTEMERGKIDVNVNIDDTGDTKSVTVNKSLAKAYYQDLKSVNDAIGESGTDYLALIMRMPDILTNEREDISPEEKTFVLDLLNEACARLNEFRAQEGAALQTEFTERIEDIRRLMVEIEPFENVRVETVRAKLEKQLEEISAGNYDNNRLEQELIFYVEKFDVSEEKMRLGNHLDYFMETMQMERSGRKLGFITQEIGREINTLGSKSNQADMQKKVVEMKDNLEKMKEQVLNTL
ncbi:MAG: YicC/YloC family endoribonuclease [Crocinitomicaceae bacterium]